MSAVIWALSTPHLAPAVLASAALFLAWLAVRRVALSTHPKDDA